jgi:hypothetical protein
VNNIEDIFDEAVTMLQKGHSEQEVLSKFAHAKNELAPLLSFSKPLLNLPKNIVPIPLMQRKYAAIPVRGFWLAWLKASKFASVSVGVLLLLSAMVGTVYASFASIPGQPLFAVKKVWEKSQLALTTNQDARASLQIQIAESRLNDAQAVFSDPGSDAAQKSAALNELANQTSNAVAEVSTVAQSNPKSTQNHPLLSSLESITQAQATLLTNIKPDSQTQTAAQSALATLDQTSVQISKIKQTVAIADNDQALASLSSNPDSVAVIGQVTKLVDNQVTVEKTSFALTTQTIIQNLEGTILSVHDLSVGQRVNVTGIKTNNILTAKFVIITEAPGDPTGSVQGTSTTTPSTSTPPTETTKTPQVTPTPTFVNSSSTAVGSFILESPSPQFAQ